MTSGITSPQGQCIIQSAIDKSRSIDFDEITKFAWQYNDDIRKVYSVASPCKSDSTDMKGIQLAIKNLQNAISTIKRFSNINSAVDALINEDVEPGKTIKKVVNVATGDIAGYVKNIMGRVRGWVLNTVQNKAKEILPFLFPGEMPSFLDKLNKATNLLSCVFAKIIRELMKTVGNLLLGLIDRFLNGPMCLVEDFVNGLLKSIMGPIEAALNSVNALLSGVTGAIASIAGSLFNMLDFITGILNFFKCDDDKVCPDQHEITRAGAGVNNDAGGDPQGPPAGGSPSPSDGAVTPGALSSGEAASRGDSDPVDFKTAVGGNGAGQAPQSSQRFGETRDGITLDLI